MECQECGSRHVTRYEEASICDACGFVQEKEQRAKVIAVDEIIAECMEAIRLSISRYSEENDDRLRKLREKHGLHLIQIVQVAYRTGAFRAIEHPEEFMTDND